MMNIRALKNGNLIIMGIWLCQSCSKLIDSDIDSYTVTELKKWKEISEQMAVLELEGGLPKSSLEDKKILRSLYSA